LLQVDERLILALDVADCDKARAMVHRLGEAVSFYKIGYRLAFSGGLALARELIQQGKKVFLDLKLHDIGNTVEEGVKALGDLGATFLTVHAYPQTMRAAALGAKGTGLKVLGVTVLTSYDNTDLDEAGFALPLEELVLRRATQAQACGLAGIVCSAAELPSLRPLLPSPFRLVTPGIRPHHSVQGDQKRIATPREALQAGADHLVIGRPILEAPDPVQAVHAILVQIKNVP
jgi:orotidine-5'-phosphate decarboxylase